MPWQASNDATQVDVRRNHAVVNHASPAYHSIRCVLHMDPRKAAHVRISLSNIIVSSVASSWVLLCHRTATFLLVLLAPRATGTVT